MILVAVHGLRAVAPFAVPHRAVGVVVAVVVVIIRVVLDFVVVVRVATAAVRRVLVNDLALLVVGIVDGPVCFAVAVDRGAVVVLVLFLAVIGA